MVCGCFPDSTKYQQLQLASVASIEVFGEMNNVNYEIPSSPERIAAEILFFHLNLIEKNGASINENLVESRGEQKIKKLIKPKKPKKK
jgi:hypothetical protein